MGICLIFDSAFVLYPFCVFLYTIDPKNILLHNCIVFCALSSVPQTCCLFVSGIDSLLTYKEKLEYDWIWNLL